MHPYHNTFCISQAGPEGRPGKDILLWNTGFSLCFFKREELIEIGQAVLNTIDLYNEIGLSTDEDIDMENFQRVEESTIVIQSSPRQQKPLKEPKNDHLYIIFDADNNAYKVGRSINPLRRFKAMLVASSHDLRLDVIYEQAGEREKRVHEALREAGLWLRGEWFKDGDKILEITESICSDCTKAYPFDVE